jgi:hypothetical protein
VAFVEPVSAAANPLVSVIVRTHAGRQHLLEAALSSIAAQEYRPIEVVVVEDGSELAGPIVERFKATPRLTVVFQGVERRGRCHAGNVGLELASGQLLNFLDDDDALFPHHLQALVARLDDDPGAVAAFGQAEIVPTTIRSLAPLDFDEHGRWRFRAHPFSRWRLWTTNQFPIQACLFRRTLYEAHGGFDEEIPILEDWELWARYLSTNERVLFLDQVTSMFRVPGAVASLHNRERELSAHMGAVKAKVGQLQVTVSAREVRAAAEQLLDDAYDDSPWLTRAWAVAGGSGLGGAVLLGVPVAATRLAGAVKRFLPAGRAGAALSPTGMALLDAATDRSNGRVVELQVREAREVVVRLWRREHPHRYALLVMRNLVAHRWLHTTRPVLAARRLLGRQPQAPPGAVGSSRSN